MLKISNLSKHFGGIKAINNCSFDIKENNITALIGPNGSGKTTVFNLISGVLKEDSGKIIYTSKDITDFSPEQVSNIGISRLFQKTQLFENLTVKENLILAIDNEDTKFLKNLFGGNETTKEKKMVKEILKSIEMESFSNKLVRDLSFGQKRLVEIARTILNPHKLLMLDEPVAGVNPKLRQKISEIILILKKKGHTILLIEHDMNFALTLADEVIVIDEGKVIAKGTPAQIKNSEEVLKAYLGD